MSINKKLSNIISKKFAPLKVKAEKRDTGIIKWYINIADIRFEAQSSGDMKEMITRPYALTVWHDFIPMLTFLKEREKEFSEYMQQWKGDNEND